jgi:hypothetical protein
MAEIAAAWTEAVVAPFERWDGNGDGLITLKECLRAAE